MALASVPEPAPPRASVFALAGPSRAAPLAGILAALVVAAFEGTVVTSAMPAIARSLGTWPVYPWGFSAFLAASMLGVLVCGRLADRLGRRPVFLASVFGFVLASLGCAFAPTGLAFVLLRAAQGAFAGAIQPVALTISADLFSLEERARIQALYTTVWGTGNLLGPLVGGALAAHASWRWGFLVSVPPALVAAYLLWTRHHEAPPERVGAASLAGPLITGLFSASLLLSLDAREGALSLRARLVSGAIALAAALAASLVERRASTPLFAPVLRHDPHVRAGLLAGIFGGGLLNACVAYVPLWLVEQRVSATRSGAALVPLLVGWAIGSTFGVRVMIRFGLRVSTSGGFTVAVLGALVLAFGARISPTIALPGLMLLGVGIGPAASTGLVAAQTHAPRELRGAVTSLVYATRAISGALAVTALALLPTSGLRFSALVAIAVSGVLVLRVTAPR